ncbi:MAG TPA: hypothetical protein VER36_12615 [Flavisolibacter sp.]|nr:hypothetical protein [Flavisolibacter sp.]
MRFVFFLLAMFFFHNAFSQDKKLLDKQLLQLLLAYPNKFRDIKKNGVQYEFHLTGGGQAGVQLRGDTNTVSMTVPIEFCRSASAANEIFEKWTKLLDEVSFNGAKLSATSCKEPGEFTTKCRIWKLDNSGGQIDKKYCNFSLTLGILHYGTSHYVHLQIGDE